MIDTEAMRQKANRQLYTWHDLVTALDEIERLRGRLETLDNLINRQLDVHHNIGKNKVSVWHPETLDRVTTCYDDHGGPMGAMEFAVSLCVQHLAKGSS